MESLSDLSWVHYCSSFIYINDLNKAIKYSGVHYFTDYTNLLLSDKSLKKIINTSIMT